VTTARENALVMRPSFSTTIQPLIASTSSRSDGTTSIDMLFPMLQSQALRLLTSKQSADLRCRFDLS
jgi:hypothetical protein